MRSFGRIALALLAWGAVTLASPARAADPRPLVWTDTDGRGYGPVHLKAAAATVFVFVSADCPLAAAYAGRIQRLEQEYFPRRVPFFLVDSHPADTAERANAWARSRGLRLPVVRDVAFSLADRLGAARTPEAVVVSRGGQVLYRGRIDDSTDEARVQRPLLREALEATLAGKPVARPAAPVTDGCLILRPKATGAKTGGVTYARQVAPLLNRSCVPCHRAGEVAPFRLDSYAQARLWAPMLADVARRRIMPPWKATPGYGDFANAHRLSEAQIALLERWAREGAPAGDLRAAPKPPAFSASWPQGEPDVVLRPGQPYALAPEGPDLYRCFVLPVEFKADTYVALSQIRPDNRAVVHHIIVYVDPTGEKALSADAADPGEGFDNPRAGADAPVQGAYWLAGWAPGSAPERAPAGVAVRVPRGARLVMEVHYHRSGRPEVDRSAIGLTFAREAVQKIHQTWPIVPPRLEIEAGNAQVRVPGTITLPADLTIYSIAPHMHQIGKEMHVWAVRPDGTREELIWLKDWDFNWQQTYRFRSPVTLPRGTKVSLEAVYDNSETNPRNPHRPPQAVRWGEATTDEMCIAFLGVTLDRQQLNVTPVAWRDAVALTGPQEASSSARNARSAAER